MAIKFKSLSFIYNKNMPYAHKALDDINLEISEGIITAIFGETGSGKSTLVEHLNALLMPTSGSLEILDYELVADKKVKFLKPLRKDVGLVFQFSEYQLFEETILKDVAFGPLNFGFSPEEALKRAKDALQLLGIPENLYDKSPLEISGGQKRRVAIAGILACDPKIIVLDEPTAGLDPRGRDDILDMILDMKNTREMTIILVSHSMDDVARYVERIMVMDEGKLVFDDEPGKVFSHYEELTQMGLSVPQVTYLMRLLKEKGIDIRQDVLTVKEGAEEILKRFKADGGAIYRR
ncbi:MAG: energy-coupling factor transporter ATPase [Erysipelotrichaceae bacterium]|nr:energy-coupling factor transporter ATPase [Erysipelotrichaceae bacterium]